MALNNSRPNADTSILNASRVCETPEVVDEKDIELCLAYVKQYQKDKESTLRLRPPGEALWPSLPSYILQRSREKLDAETTKSLPTNSELNSAISAFVGDNKLINYNEFLAITSSFPSSVLQLFDPRNLWGKLASESDVYGRLPTKIFIDIYANTITSIKYRSTLENFSFIKPGYLKYEELINFMTYILDDSSLLEGFEAYRTSIIDTFTELILFKGGNKNEVKITDVVISNVIAEIYEPEEFSHFSIPYFVKIYNEFISMAVNDVLPKAKLYETFSNVVPAFWDSYLRRYHGCENASLYFIDFYKIHYMLDNLLEAVVVRTLFRAMDIDDDGVFSVADYRPFHEQLMPQFTKLYGGTYFELSYIYDSLFDMALADKTNKITVQGLLATKKFDDFFNTACNVYEFAILEDVINRDGDEEEENTETQVEVPEGTNEE